MPPRKNQFRFKFDSDLILLSEVESQNPFAFKNQKPVWAEIASKCKEIDSIMDVSERSCRERVELLLKQFDKDESISKRASGVLEEDMDKMKLLLTNIKKLKLAPPDPTLQKLYSKSSRLEAEQIRADAISLLETSAESSLESSPAPNTDADGNAEDEDDASATTPVSRKRKGLKLDPGEYLMKKLELESGFKQDELRIRELEAANRKLEIEFQKEKLEQEMQLKRAKLELDKSAQQSQSQERSQLMELVSKLMGSKNA